VPVLQIVDLFFKYRWNREWVLKGIDLEVEEGEFVAIIGPNGGGKTTLLKIVLGFLQPCRGKVLLFGRPPVKSRHLIGYVPQYTTFGETTPLEVIDVVLEGRMAGWHLFPNRKDRQIGIEILERLGIAHLQNKLIRELSGGERQKVLIARALATNPRLIIMDEPTSAIDIEGQREILDLIESMEITRLVVSHDIKILMRKVDKIVYIQQTGIIHSGPKLQIPLDRHFCEVELVELLRSQEEKDYLK